MRLIEMLSVLLLSLSMSAQEAPLLVPGQPVTGEMAGGQTHSYRLALKKGQFVRLVADQRNVDLVLQVADAAEQSIASADVTSYGSLESLSFESPGEGEYRLTVRGRHPQRLTGTYELRAMLRDAPGAEDRTRIAAERLMREAATLRGPAALEKQEQAVAAWRELGDEYWLTRSLAGVGETARLIGKMDKALPAIEEMLTLARKNRDRVGEANALRMTAILSSMRGQFTQSMGFCEQELEIRRVLGDRVGEAGAYLTMGINNGQLGQPLKALEYLDKAIAIHRELKNPDGERFPLHNSGDIYQQMGRTDLAIERFELAIAAHRAAKDRLAEANALSTLGMLASRQGEMAKAFENVEKALAISREINDRSGEAAALLNLGFLARQQGEADKALGHMEEALRITRAIRAVPNEARTLLAMADAHFAANRFDKSQQAAEQAAALAQQARLRTVEAGALNSLANVFSILGRYERALEAYQQSLEIYRAAKARAFEAGTLSNMGLTYEFLGQPEKAIEYHEQALALQRELKMVAGLDLTLNNLGSAHRKLGNFDRAIQYYEEAIALMRGSGNKMAEAATTGNLLNCYFSLGQLEKAQGYGERALALSRETNDRAVEARTLNNLGNIYFRLGRVAEAEEMQRKSIALNRELNNRFSEAPAHLGLALAEKAKGNLREALAAVEEGIRLIDELRGNLVSAELRSSFFTKSQDYYLLQIELLELLEKANPGQGFGARALEAGERARARGLLDMLSESRADIKQGVDGKLLDRERLLAAQIAAKAERLRGRLTPEQATGIKQELNALETAHQLTQAEIRKNSPGYAALTQPEPLKLAEIQAQLDPETLLLHYSLGRERGYLWVVSQTDLKSYELAKYAEIEQAARRVYHLLTDRGRAPKGESPAQRRAREARADGGLQDAARNLSQLTLGPIAGVLKAQRLVIVADGALQYIPFGFLPAPERDSSRARRRASGEDYRPMIADHEIVTLPSASTLAVLRRELAARIPAPNGVAVIADPVFSEDDQRFKAIAPKNADAPAPPTSYDPVATRSIEHLAKEEAGPDGARKLIIPALPFTRTEAEQILAAAPGPGNFEALGFKANRSAALSPDLSRYRYIHFATHGYLDTERPGLSALLLSMVDENGRPQNGFLRANDIYNLKLPAELVVLSACQTGLGKEIRGEGLVGLTRGFMYAGAPRVVVSLWNVNDRATSDLMGRFYRKMLKEKQRPAAALRAAQIEMWKSREWRSPYYWAAFGLQGEWR